MADSGLLATISGPALSLLFYENACSVGDQMGFLLGDVVMFVTKNVTDSERQVESVRRQIEITGILACSSVGQLFDETGKLHTEKLRVFVNERNKEIVGWFRFRHNNRPVPTFRDKILHKELAKYFLECNSQLSKEYFLACILNATKTEKLGIHKFRHVLLRYQEGMYRPVALRINNLGKDEARQDGSDYMPKPMTRFSREPDVFTKFVRSLKLDTRHKTGSELVTAIQKAAECHVKALIPKVCESDREIFEIEKELKELRMKIVSGMMIPKKFSVDNQRINESNNRGPMRTEGDQSIQMEIREETTPRTPSMYREYDADKESSLSKTKGIMKPISMTHTMRTPNDSAQRSPSSRFSQASRKSTDSDDMFEDTDC